MNTLFIQVRVFSFYRTYIIKSGMWFEEVKIKRNNKIKVIYLFLLY